MSDTTQPRLCARCGAAPTATLHPNSKYCATCRQTRDRESKHAKRNAAKRQEIAERAVRLCARCGVNPTRTKHLRCLYCAECEIPVSRERALKNFQDNREERLESKRQYRLQNREILRAKSQEYHSRPDVRARSLAKTRLRLYGVTPEVLGSMLHAQDSRCPLCDSGLDANAAHVDHCHKTGEVRGLLCRACNLDLGVVEKLRDAGRLEKMLAYLRPEEVRRAS